MANTYTQIYIHFVFAVANRTALIEPAWEDELQKYMTGIVRNLGHKMIAINGMPDHLHMLIGFHPTQSISDFMRVVKGESSEWINYKGFTRFRFQWQQGYGAFSYSKDQVDRLYHYIMNQKEHHRRKKFRDEYEDLLKYFDIEFEERFLFHDPR